MISIITLDQGGKKQEVGPEIFYCEMLVMSQFAEDGTKSR